MAKTAAFLAFALLCLAGAQGARMLKQEEALAPGSIYNAPPPPSPGKDDPKTKGKTLGDLTGLKGIPPIGTFIFPNGTTCANSGIGNIGCSNNGNFNLGFDNTGAFNKGSDNNGNFNDASGNLGNFNKGGENAGSFNTGNQNNGNYNPGNQNNGNYNTGNQNAGLGNSGNANNGIGNAGDRNNGNFNGGDLNMGSGNNGSTNSGEGNLGSDNQGDFNTASGQTGSYIGPDGSVIVYPIQVATAPATVAATPPPTLSQVLASVFGGSSQGLIPITSTTSLGDLVNSLG